MPVNAIRGYLDMTATLLTRRRPTRYVACLDLDWRPAFRVALVPSYKAHRVAPAGGETIPDTLTPADPGAARGPGGAGPGGRRRRRLRSRRRHRHPRRPRSGSGRDRHRRSRPDRARDRVRARPLHRTGPGQDGGPRPGRGAGEVRRAACSLPRLRRAAGRPERRPARGRGYRREDRGGDRLAVRPDRGDPGRGGRTARPVSRPAPRRRCSPPATT